jgi:hypothetical protein
LRRQLVEQALPLFWTLILVFAWNGTLIELATGFCAIVVSPAALDSLRPR